MNVKITKEISKCNEQVNLRIQERTKESLEDTVPSRESKSVENPDGRMM